LTNCCNCFGQLGIYDLKHNSWNTDVEEFVFICPVCKTENTIRSSLFKNNHIALHYLTLYKENQINIPIEQKKILEEHVRNCPECTKALNELLLTEIEDKFRFNEQSFEFFSKHAKLIAKQLDDGRIVAEIKDGHASVKFFEFEDKKYQLTESDEFYRKDDFLEGNQSLPIERIAYYLFEAHWLLGMVSFLAYKDKLVLEKIWFKPPNIINLEKKFIDDLKKRRIDLKLDTLKDFSKQVFK
jgi:hypothetical protein